MLKSRVTSSSRYSSRPSMAHKPSVRPSMAHKPSIRPSMAHKPSIRPSMVHQPNPASRTFVSWANVKEFGANLVSSKKNVGDSFNKIASPGLFIRADTRPFRDLVDDGGFTGRWPVEQIISDLENTHVTGYQEFNSPKPFYGGCSEIPDSLSFINGNEGKFNIHIAPVDKLVPLAYGKVYADIKGGDNRDYENEYVALGPVNIKEIPVSIDNEHIARFTAGHDVPNAAAEFNSALPQTVNRSQFESKDTKATFKHFKDMVNSLKEDASPDLSSSYNPS
jgi:hypothetical protein